MASSTFLCLLGMLCIIGASAAGRDLLQESSPASQIPPECQAAGLQLQDSNGPCASDLSKAQAFFGGISGAADKAKLDQYLSNPANKVSAGCCTLAQTFNNAKCNCNKAVQDLAASFVGGDVSTYNAASSAVAQSCGFSKIC